MTCCLFRPYPIESLPEGWVTAQVTFRHKDGRQETRLEIIDLKTKTRYLHEPMHLTAFKCFELVLFTGVYLAGYLAFHLIRTLCTPIQVAWADRSLNKATEAFCIGLWTIVRAPFYALGIEFAAFYGIFKPLEGRAAIAEWEKNWHEKPRQKDFGHADRDFTLGQVCHSFCDPNFSYTFFLASCMQPIGRISDPHLLSILK